MPARMKRALQVSAAAIGMIVSPCSLSAADRLLEDGEYAVEVRLELPHLEDLNYRTETRLCLTSEAGKGNHGFRILSDNNPLHACPARDIRQDGDTLAFRIDCQTTSNLAKATATYRLSARSFEGRIDMTMAGKNMTMSEIQSGHRVGACKAHPARS